MSPAAVWVAPSLWPLLALSKIRWQRSNELSYQYQQAAFPDSQQPTSTSTNMKIQKPNSIIITILIAAVATLFVAGCAEMGSGNTTSLLSAAGFRVRSVGSESVLAVIGPAQVFKLHVVVKGRV